MSADDPTTEKQKHKPRRQPITPLFSAAGGSPRRRGNAVANFAVRRGLATCRSARAPVGGVHAAGGEPMNQAREASTTRPHGNYGRLVAVPDLCVRVWAVVAQARAVLARHSRRSRALTSSRRRSSLADVCTVSWLS